MEDSSTFTLQKEKKKKKNNNNNWPQIPDLLLVSRPHLYNLNIKELRS